jgi:hypothetical protein
MYGISQRRIGFKDSLWCSWFIGTDMGQKYSLVHSGTRLYRRNIDYHSLHVMSLAGHSGSRRNSLHAAAASTEILRTQQPSDPAPPCRFKQIPPT